jgi:hypothetical protein
MSEIMTIEEIYKLFPSEWVLLDEVQSDEHYQVLGGKVVFHSKDRQETDDKLLELKPKRFAVRYTGERPDNVILIL